MKSASEIAFFWLSEKFCGFLILGRLRGLMGFLVRENLFRRFNFSYVRLGCGKEVKMVSKRIIELFIELRLA